jgi:hypothetical protein
VSKLSLLIRAKAMVLSYRNEKSSEAICAMLTWQSWAFDTRLRFARVRRIADGLAPEPSHTELFQLSILVEEWEANTCGN